MNALPSKHISRLIKTGLEETREFGGESRVLFEAIGQVQIDTESKHEVDLGLGAEAPVIPEVAASLDAGWVWAARQLGKGRWALRLRIEAATTPNKEPGEGDG